MKTATIPSILMQPELREELESLLKEEGSLSELVPSVVLANVRQRRDSTEFMQRGLCFLGNTSKEDEYVKVNDVLKKLSQKLAQVKASPPGAVAPDAK